MKQPRKGIAIIIPTFNAREGILKTISRIKKIVPEAMVIVVDDNSPDGTADLITQHFPTDTKVIVINRNRKGGRGSAVIAGFKYALKDKENAYFIEMDADLCHHPKYIPQMISATRSSDVVIASKYLPDSTISGLNFKRKVMSQLMNKMARIILQVPVTDYSNGYRCYTRPVITYLLTCKFQSKGFIVLSEILSYLYKKGFTISEIPFDFKQENIAKSNLRFSEIREAVFTLLILRVKAFSQWAGKGQKKKHD